MFLYIMAKIMDRIFLKIADFIIGLKLHKSDPFQVKELFQQVATYYYRGFRIDKPKKVDAWIEVVQNTSFKVLINPKESSYYINFYKERNKKLITYYHVSYNHLKVVVRKPVHRLLVKNKGLILHGSASLINKKACLFLGDSGAGKSTIVEILTKKFTPLADDNLIIRKYREGYYFFQTPFIESNYSIKKTSERFPLGKIFVLRKGRENKITPINNKQIALSLLAKQLITDSADVNTQMKIVFEMISELDLYKLEFTLGKKDNLIKILENEI